MADTTKNLHPNTIAFVCLEPQVALLIADIIHAIYSKLNWRQSSKSFLIEILTRLGELNKFECSHLAFSEALFPALEEVARKVKVGRWSQKLIEDMTQSEFQAVWVIPRRVKQSESGKYYGLPTLYKRGDFWKLFRAVQSKATECDLLNLPLRNRRQEIRVIVGGYLNKIGAKRIVREKKEKSEKEKTPSLPCKCDCAHCYYCDLRDEAPSRAMASEADGARPAEGRVDRASVAKRIAAAFDDVLFECGQDWMNLGMSLGSFAFQLDKECEQTEHRLREAMVRANKSKIRLVGG